jgi:3-oxoacyl-[acyl-carrier-protein] synthase-1
MSISIVASGMVTPVGFNGPASLAAMRAGISGVAFEELWDVEQGEHLRAARVHTPQWWEGLGKLAELAAPAIAECLRAAEPLLPSEIPILLCGPARGVVARHEGTDEELLRAVESRLGTRIHGASRTVSADQVSAVVALSHARQLIGQSVARVCVIAGVDSFLEQVIVDAFVASRRVMTASNSNGFFPGEAAAAVLVRSSTENGPELRLIGVGFGREEANVNAELPLRGEGLACAVRAALLEAQLPFHDIDYRITDLNGEHYKFKEATLLVGRLLRKRKEERFELWHPIEFLGEIGAAVGPTVLGIALHAARQGYAPGKTVLCHFGNDTGERAAVVMRYA